MDLNQAHNKQTYSLKRNQLIIKETSQAVNFDAMYCHCHSAATPQMTSPARSSSKLSHWSAQKNAQNKLPMLQPLSTIIWKRPIWWNLLRNYLLWRSSRRASFASDIFKLETDIFLTTIAADREDTDLSMIWTNLIRKSIIASNWKNCGKLTNI